MSETTISNATSTVGSSIATVILGDEYDLKSTKESTADDSSSISKPSTVASDNTVISLKGAGGNTFSESLKETIRSSNEVTKATEKKSEELREELRAIERRFADKYLFSQLRPVCNPSACAAPHDIPVYHAGPPVLSHLSKPCPEPHCRTSKHESEGHGHPETHCHSDLPKHVNSSGVEYYKRHHHLDEAHGVQLFASRPLSPRCNPGPRPPRVCTRHPPHRGNSNKDASLSLRIAGCASEAKGHDSSFIRPMRDTSFTRKDEDTRAKQVSDRHHSTDFHKVYRDVTSFNNRFLSIDGVNVHDRHSDNKGCMPPDVHLDHAHTHRDVPPVHYNPTPCPGKLLLSTVSCNLRASEVANVESPRQGRLSSPEAFPSSQAILYDATLYPRRLASERLPPSPVPPRPLTALASVGRNPEKVFPAHTKPEDIVMLRKVDFKCRGGSCCSNVGPRLHSHAMHGVGDIATDRKTRIYRQTVASNYKAHIINQKNECIKSFAKTIRRKPRTCGRTVWPLNLPHPNHIKNWYPDLRDLQPTRIVAEQCLESDQSSLAEFVRSHLDHKQGQVPDEPDAETERGSAGSAASLRIRMRPLFGEEDTASRLECYKAEQSGTTDNFYRRQSKKSEYLRMQRTPSSKTFPTTFPSTS